MPTFLEGELIGELDDELAIALALTEGHYKDAREVILKVALFSREVSHEVVAHLVVLDEHIEIERIDVVMESLVVKEEF